MSHCCFSNAAAGTCLFFSSFFSRFQESNPRVCNFFPLFCAAFFAPEQDRSYCHQYHLHPQRLSIFTVMHHESSMFSFSSLPLPIFLLSCSPPFSSSLLSSLLSITQFQYHIVSLVIENNQSFSTLTVMSIILQQIMLIHQRLLFKPLALVYHRWASSFWFARWKQSILSWGNSVSQFHLCNLSYLELTLLICGLFELSRRRIFQSNRSLGLLSLERARKACSQLQICLRLG